MQHRYRTLSHHRRTQIELTIAVVLAMLAFMYVDVYYPHAAPFSSPLIGAFINLRWIWAE